MIKRLPDLEAWAIFARVAQLGSFSRAARELGLSDPTISKAIARLEARPGLTLFARTSRRIALTETGHIALERAIRILNEGEAVEEEAVEQGSTPRGRVRVSAPLSFGVNYLGPVLPQFLESFPEITVDLSLCDRQVDLVAEGFDLALRIATLDNSSMLSRRLCMMRLFLVAAPSYLQHHGTPTHPSDLTHHQALIYTGGSLRDIWRFSHPVLGEETVHPSIRMWSDNAEVHNPALIAGQGLAIQPEFMIWREVQEGKLVIVLPDWSITPLNLHLVMPPSPLRPRRVQVLIDYLASQLARAPWAVKT